MGSSFLNKIFDGFRNTWVERTPEEVVRQAFLHKITQELGYPKELVVVEKELSELPHLKTRNVPIRRVDILCYGRSPEGTLFPLLLVECKKEMTKGDEQQLLGYNAFVQAPFFALVAQKNIFFASAKTNKLFSSFPSYQELVKLYDA